VRTISDQEVRELIGNVHLVQIEPGEIIRIWCDSARQFVATNKVELFGHVRITRDGVTVTAPEGVYFGDERRAAFTKSVRLEKGAMTLTSAFGEYFADEKKAIFVHDVTVVDSVSSTKSNALTYFDTEEKSIAVGDVSVTSSENNVTVYGDSLVHFAKRAYTIVPKNPRLVQIDTSEGGIIDTLVVMADVMEAYRDTVHRFVAKGNVAMARNDFVARCGEAVYLMKRERIGLRDQPVVWHRENQVTGDSIAVTLFEKRLRSIYVKGRAMAVSRSDSLFRNRFDQLTGRELTMYFAGNKLERVEAERNAVSLYYLFEDQTPNGMNRSSGDRIAIEFQEGKAGRIKVVGGVEGRFFPEPMIAKRESHYNLDGFRWIEARPKRSNLHVIREAHD